MAIVVKPDEALVAPPRRALAAVLAFSGAVVIVAALVALLRFFVQ